MTASIETQGRTRESWLEAAVEVFRPRFVEVGHPLPSKLHVSAGRLRPANRRKSTHDVHLTEELARALIGHALTV